MSVSQILSASGTILPQYLDTDAITSGFVRNPLTATLVCYNPDTATLHEITQAGRVETSLLQTDTVELVPGSLQTAVKFNNSVELATGTQLQFQTAGEIRPGGGQTLTLREFLAMPDLPDSTGTPLPNVVAYDTTTGALSFQPAGGGGGGITNPMTANLDGGAFDITNVATMTATTVSTVAGANLDAVASRVAFRPTLQLFVAPNGNDLTGDGSATAPFATIQKAITEAELTASSSNRFLISVAPGRYIESLTFTTGYVWVQGSGSSTSMSTLISRIQGNISVAIGGADDLFNKVVSLSGFQITGSLTDTSTAQHSTSVTNCYLFNSGRCLYYNSSASTSRNAVYDCFINSETISSDPAVEIASGWLDIQRTPVSTNNNASLLVVSGTAYLYKCVLCPFENGNTSATLAPLVLISSTAPGVIHNLFANSFVMTSAVNKTGSAASSAVRLVGAPIVLLQNSFISLAGTVHPANHAVTTTAAGTLLTYGNACNQAVGTDKIQGGITHIALSTLS